MNLIDRFHYITNTSLSEVDQIKLVAKAGVRWVQIRIKDRLRAEIELPRLIEVAKGLGLIVILNDYVDLALKYQTDGVHLGKKDLNPEEARCLLGDKAIVGATINCIEDLETLKIEAIDYVGLGPFRFTSTKDNLGPILGLPGLKLVQAYIDKNFCGLPIIAIGGIRTQDLPDIESIGVHGIAVSSAITNSNTPLEVLQKFISYGEYDDQRLRAS